MDTLLSSSQSPSSSPSADQAEQKEGETSSPGTPSAPVEGARSANKIEQDLATQLDQYSLEAVVELKISRFLDQIGNYYPEDLHALIMRKVEKPLITQILKRTGGNQVHASKILGINRNTLRKKMKMYGL